MKNINQILQERQTTHGNFADNAYITQELKHVCKTYFDKLNYQQIEALEMIFHKIGRILAGNPNEKDHWLDIAGYAMLVEELLENQSVIVSNNK